MNIKEFINKVEIHNDGWHFESLLESLSYCIGCIDCPFFDECVEKRERGEIFSCEEMLKKHLTTD